MTRRDFLHTGLGALGVLALGACTTSATPTTTAMESQGQAGAAAERRRELDAAADGALARLDRQIPNAPELRAKAAGMLIFPHVIAAGLGLGGQYGEGALRLHGTSVGYYSLASVSVGLQIGAQSKAIVLLFMTQEALNKFRASSGWSAGADASVAVLHAGANGNVEVGPGMGPVLAFVLTNAGLMANLNLEGTKISPLRI